MKQNNILVSLYLNYIIHGISIIAIAQNATILSEKLNVDFATIIGVISILGLGRLLSHSFVGFISDKFGRLVNIMIALTGYFIFFSGLIFPTGLYSLMITTAFGGLANAALDTGTYPLLVDEFKNKHSILIKAFISIGETIYPLIVSFCLFNNISYIYPLLAILSILLLNFIIFKNIENKRIPNKIDYTKISINWVLLAYRVFVYMTFYCFVIWIAKYTQITLGIIEAEAIKIVSFYGIGSFMGVLIFTLFSNRLKEFNILNPFISIFSIILLQNTNSLFLYQLFTFIIGLTMAGGLIQSALILFIKDKENQAKLVSIFMIAGSLTGILGPIITKNLYIYGIENVFFFITFTCIMSFILSIVYYFKEKGAI